MRVDARRARATARASGEDGTKSSTDVGTRAKQIFVRDARASATGRARGVDVVPNATTAREVLARALRASEREDVRGLALTRRRRPGETAARAEYADDDVIDADATSRGASDVYEIVRRRGGDGRAMTLGLLGGGGDGGATGAESRSAYLEMYAWNGGTTFSRKKESLGGFVRYSAQSTVRDRDEAEEDLARWFTCALTEEPLESGENGVVVDRVGALYNKEPVLKALRDKAIDGVALPKRIEHITGMKALVTCKFEKRRADKSSKVESSSVNARNFRCGNAEAVFACPITGLDFNGKTKFVVMRPSGVVVADKALREAKAAVEEMNDGLKLADAPPPIPVNPRGEELELLKAILDEEKAKKDSKKKAKRGKSDATRGDAGENAAKRKKFVAQAPKNADAAVYASLFTSSADPADDKDDDFLARNARKAW
jgi:hypothetical protein|tara:strand:- start:153 stop:1442 length:1290 start_codon:yes stop_codon:yes gene_type:complete